MVLIILGLTAEHRVYPSRVGSSIDRYFNREARTPPIKHIHPIGPISIPQELIHEGIRVEHYREDDDQSPFKVPSHSSYTSRLMRLDNKLNLFYGKCDGVTRHSTILVRLSHQSLHNSISGDIISVLTPFVAITGYSTNTTFIIIIKSRAK